MRAIWNGFVSFGLVTIPVSVGLAQQRSDVSFRTLARETLQPVKQKRWDPINDVEVGSDETVKGWEVSKGRYLPVEDSELEQFAARQAEAERERRAKVIAADGEYQASEKLGQAAAVISAAPGALQLRYLQTMNEIGSSERTTTLILPFPVELLEALSGHLSKSNGAGPG